MAKTSRTTSTGRRGAAARPRSRGARGAHAGHAQDRETEQRILEAARKVFIRRGTAGARMKEIAAEAGVNQALLHYYFRSKGRLSSAVFQQVATRIFPVLVQVLGGDLPLDTKIERVVSLYIEHLSENPFAPVYILSELHHNPQRVGQLLEAATGQAPRQMLPAALQVLERQIDAEVRAGRMRPISALGLAVNLISLCIFPFAARPMLPIAFQMDDAGFARFMASRKPEVIEFVRNALRP